MKKYLCLLVFILCFYSSFNAYSASETRTFLERWNSPNNNFFLPLANYTESFISYYINELKGLHNICYGDRINVFSYNIHSFHKTKKDVSYGSAIYNYGCMHNQKWSLISDYELVEPYILASDNSADSYFEEYNIDGGYGLKISENCIFGIGGQYKTKIQYRRIDPRPKNDISDYLITIGLSYILKQKYSISADLKYGEYTQKNNISNFREDTGTLFFFLKPFGFYDNKKSGKTSLSRNLYEGENYGVNISLIPVSENGYSLGFTYLKTNICNYILENNPINRFDINKYVLGFGNLFQINNKTIGYNIKVTNKNKKVKEFQYETKWNLKNEIYQDVFVTSGNKYHNNQFDLNLSGLYRMKFFNKKIVYCIPRINFYNKNIQYDNSKYIEKVETILSEFNVGIIKKMKANSLLLELGIGYRKKLKSNFTEPTSNNYDRKILEELVRVNFLYNSVDYRQISLKFRYDYFLDSNLNLFAKLKTETYLINKKANYNIKIMCGLLF